MKSGTVWIVEKEFKGKITPCVDNYLTKKLALQRMKEMKEIGFVANLCVKKYVRAEPEAKEGL